MLNGARQIYTVAHHGPFTSLAIKMFLFRQQQYRQICVNVLVIIPIINSQISTSFYDEYKQSNNLTSSSYK